MTQTPKVELPHIHESLESVEKVRERLGRELVKLLIVLMLLGVMAIGGIAVALYEITLQAEVRLLILGACGGLLGSCISAGISAAQRYSDGVETRDGRQYPETEKSKPRFNEAMIPFFYLRPFLGAGMGVLAYAGLVAGLLFTTGSTGSTIAAVRPESVLFAAGVAGLFAKTLIEKLKNSFDQIVGK